MTKGAASIVLIIAALVYAALERWNGSRLGRSFWLALSLFLLAVLPWHLYMFHLFGASFLTEYFGFHVLARATHQIEDHVTHWWYYFWVLLISAAPFVLLYPFAIVDSFRRKEERAWSIFALVVVGFFTVVQTRLPHYIAPAYPAFALLTSVFLADRLRVLQRSRQQSPKSFWTAVTVLATSILHCQRIPDERPPPTPPSSQGRPRHCLCGKGIDPASARRLPPTTPCPGPAPRLVGGQREIHCHQRLLCETPRPADPAATALSSGVPTDKYLFQPETLDDALRFRAANRSCWTSILSSRFPADSPTGRSPPDGRWKWDSSHDNKTARSGEEPSTCCSRLVRISLSLSNYCFRL